MDYQDDQSFALFDRNIRSKGTILSLLENDYFSIIKSQHPHEVIDCSHYPLPQKVVIFHLKNKEFGVFDRLEVRSTNLINPAIPPEGVTLTFTSSEASSLDNKIAVIKKIQAIYGDDSLRNGVITKKEVSHLKSDKWFQRVWYFNQYHSLYDSDFSGDKPLYEVDIINMGADGLELRVDGFREEILEL
jgi:hypothetical protein